MKTQRTSATKRGFTLMELMVAMAITTIIVTVLVSITSIALETWNRSRAELRASRQAKSMIDTIARDFESLVTRRGNTSEWLSAVTATTAIGDNLKSSNASELVFFTAATDRYDGNIGNAKDKGGDVSCVAYRLEYRDPIVAGGASAFKTFVLNRVIVNPDDTFNDLLGKTDSTTSAKSLESVFNGSAYAAGLSSPENFVGENIFQFTVTFHVQVTIPAAGAAPPTNIVVPVMVGQKTKNFKISGNGIVAPDSAITVGNTAISAAQIATGRVTAVEISATVISDFGIDQLRKRTFSSTQESEFLTKNSYEYTKLVQLPSM